MVTGPHSILPSRSFIVGGIHSPELSVDDHWCLSLPISPAESRPSEHIIDGCRDDQDRQQEEKYPDSDDSDRHRDGNDQRHRHKNDQPAPQARAANNAKVSSLWHGDVGCARILRNVGPSPTLAKRRAINGTVTL